MTRKRAKSPLKAAMDASSLMWESFGKMTEKMDSLNEEVNLALSAQSGFQAQAKNTLRLIQKSRSGQN